MAWVMASRHAPSTTGTDRSRYRHRHQTGTGDHRRLCGHCDCAAATLGARDQEEVTEVPLMRSRVSLRQQQGGVLRLDPPQIRTDLAATSGGMPMSTTATSPQWRQAGGST